MGRPSNRSLAPFGERLREAIKHSSFRSRAAFARHHEIDGPTLYRYEVGDRSPPIGLAAAFADSLGISLDVLAGRVAAVGAVPPTETKRNIAVELGGRISAARTAKGLTQHRLAELVGSRAPQISRWERGEVMPEIRYAVPLADALGITTDELLGR